MMDGFSFSEIVIIIIIAIIIYGKDLPQAARKLANIYAKFKRQLSDVREEIRRQIPMDEIQDSMKLDLPSGPGGEPPSTPSYLSASVSPGQVHLSWNSSVGATSYTIRRSTGSQDPWLICAMNLTDLMWIDTDVQAGKTYHYVVTGVNQTGESGNSDEAVAVIPPDPGAPALEVPPLPSPAATAPSTPAPTNGNGEYPKEPAIPEEKAAAPAPSAAPAQPKPAEQCTGPPAAESLPR